MVKGHREVVSLLLMSSSLIVLTGVPAFAQSLSDDQPRVAQSTTTTQAAEVSADAAAAEDIVVTGTSTRQRKFDAPYSVSTVDQQRIEDTAPTSVADLLSAIPGVTVEASGGEGGGENIVIRGLPWSGWRLIDLNQDGMPLYESNFERYFNIDQNFRVDLDTKRAEIVRGGTAPIYSNNASGGVVNFITGHGTPQFEGAVRLETGTGERTRGDVAVSGPLADRLSGSISGFFRRDNGLRDPGYKNADIGGQIKAGINYDLGQGRLWADVKYLNDRSVFYTAVPLVSPLDGSSLERLIDPRDGTLTSRALRRVTLRTIGANGQATTVTRDLQDGIHPKTLSATVGGDYEIGGGFHLYNTYRHTGGTTLVNGLYNGAPTGAAAYLATRLAAARTAFGNNVTSLRYVIAGTNTVYDPATTANLVMPNTFASVSTKFRYDADDIHVTKDLETPLGTHSLTAGIYYASFDFRQTQLLNAVLNNVQNQPLALDIQAIGGTGQVLGNVTENGFIAYGNGSQSGRVQGHSFAFYAADTWKITPAWSIDAGIRRVERDQSGVQGVLGTVAANPTGPIPARSVTGVVREVARSEKPKGTSWTVGTGYIFSPSANVFARYTSTFSYPRFDNILGGSVLPNSTTPIPVSDIKLAEGGLKYAFPSLRLVATGFWSKFNVLNGGAQIADANGLITNSNIIFDTRTYGIELEAVANPFDGVEIVANGMVQKPIYTRVDTLTGLDASSTKGGDVARVPRFQLSIEPSYSFEVASLKARVFTTYFTIGRRFQDASNLSRLPAYSTFDIGASLVSDHGLELRGVVSNVGNVLGLTEGNARSAAVLAGSVSDATVGRSIFGRNFTLSLTRRW